MHTVPLIGFAEAGAGGYFDDGGFPVGKGWEEIAFPSVNDEHAYALEISGDSMKPAYRDGDVIIVSPAAPVRKGDRVVVKTKDGEVMVKELKRKTAEAVELKSLNAEHRDRTLPMAESYGSRASSGQASSADTNLWHRSFHLKKESAYLCATRQRAVDHVDRILQAIDRGRTIQSADLFLAQQDLIEQIEPIERHARLAVLRLLFLVQEGLAAG